jgi:hypothetical protein
MRRRIDTKATYNIDPGAYAAAAHAAAQVGYTGTTLGYLEVVRAVPGSDFMLDDSLDHIFLAVAQLGLRHADADVATLALAAGTTYRTTHTVLPNKPREELTDRLADQARALLPTDEFDASWERGTTFRLDDIIDLALDRYGNGASS